MNRKISVAAGAFLGLAWLALPARLWAQGGGKAEGLPVEFKQGRAVYKGRVRNAEEAEYDVAARQGQRLTIRLTATPRRSATVKALDPSGKTLTLQHRSGLWSATLPGSGHYLVSVLRPGGKPGATRYTVTFFLK